MKNIIIKLNKYTGAIFCFAIGIFLLYNRIERPALNNYDDVLEIQGSIKNYSFHKEKTFRGTVIQYYFWLDEYPNKFQIKADYESIFNKIDFEKNINSGNQVSLKIPNDLNSMVGEHAQIIAVVEIRDEKQIYLNFEKVMVEDQAGEALELIYGIGLLITGVGLFYIKKMNLIEKRQPSKTHQPASGKSPRSPLP